MGYMCRELRNLVEEMERTFVIPNGWNKYLYQVEQNHNIIIKNLNNMYYCTNCQQTFENKKSRKKHKKQRKQKMICPNCKMKYNVKSNRLKHLEYKDNIIMLDKVKGKLIVRVFEMCSKYNADKQEFEHSTVEYSRRLVEDGYRELRNERIQPGVTSYCVNHYRVDDGQWRLYTGYWYETVMAGFVYKDNLKEVLKNTIYEKSRLWELIRKPTREYYNIKNLLYEAKQDSFEMLVELKLYNLAENASYFFQSKGSFYKIFGVNKEYYDFMRKHNITKEQLEILKRYQTKDIKKIKFLEKYRYVIEDILAYTTIDNFITYFRTKKLKDAHLYIDYLKFVKEIGLDLKNKRYLFPDRLKTMHDKYEEQIKQIREEEITKKIEERAKELANNIYKNKNFIIFPAGSINAMIDESKQQNNCVRTYTESYAEGKCDIYFMRKANNIETSLVTVEVKNNEIVQKRTRNNKETTKQQDDFLNIWQKNILQNKLKQAV